MDHGRSCEIHGWTDEGTELGTQGHA